MEHFSISTGELCGFCPSNTWPMNHQVVQRNRKVGSSLNTAATIEALMLGIVLGTVPWSRLRRFRMKGFLQPQGCEKGGGGAMSWTKSLGYTISNIL